LHTTAATLTPGSKLTKPCTTAPTERAIAEASHISTMGACSHCPISADEPAIEVALDPSNRPIMPSSTWMSASSAARAKVRSTPPCPIM
jgi:hypothetical protein